MSEGMPTPRGYSRCTGTVRALDLDGGLPGRTRQRLGAPDGSRSSSRRPPHWFAPARTAGSTTAPETPIRDWLRMPHPFAAYGIERGSPFEPGYRELLIQDIAARRRPRTSTSAATTSSTCWSPRTPGPPAAHAVLSVTFADNQEAPERGRRPAGQRLVRLQSAGRRFRALPRARVPGPATRERPRLRAARPLHHGGRRPVGHWDVMSEDWGAGNDLLAWHKWKLGWLDRRQVGLRRQARHLGSHAQPGWAGRAASSSPSYPSPRSAVTPWRCVPTRGTTRRCAGPAFSSPGWTPGWIRVRDR